MVRAGAEVVRVTAMSRADLPQVVAIDAAASSRPWPIATFLTELAREDRRYLVARLGSGPDGSGPHGSDGAGGDGEVVGFGGVALLGDEAHVMTVAVDPARQGRGIGGRVVSGLLDEVVAAGLTATTLEVRTSNDVARRLYHRLGFDEAGVRPGYYPDGEDAVILWRHTVAEVS